jgi:hypothetical protein
MGRFDWDRSAEDRSPRRPVPWLTNPGQILPLAVERTEQVEHGRERNRNQGRGRERVLDATGATVLTDVGTFRAVALEDIARYHYRGNIAHALNAMNRLARMGLIEYRSTRPGPVTYVTLTHHGCRAVRRWSPKNHPVQNFSSGFVRPRDARHDAALYGLYQQQSSQIAARNGRVTRLVLEADFVRSINRRLSKIRHLTQSEQLEQKQAIAQELGLRVVNGKIPIPDLRLEYEGPDHEQGKMDLELVTENYSRGSLAFKAQAGFALYALAEDFAHRRSAMPDPEIMRGILS